MTKKKAKAVKTLGGASTARGAARILAQVQEIPTAPVGEDANVGQPGLANTTPTEATGHESIPTPAADPRPNLQDPAILPDTTINVAPPEGSIPVPAANLDANQGQPNLAPTKMAQSIPTKPPVVAPNKNHGYALPSATNLMGEGSQRESIPNPTGSPQARRSIPKTPMTSENMKAPQSGMVSPGATVKSDGGAKVPTGARDMGKGSSKADLPKPGASATYKKNSPTVLRANQEITPEQAVSLRLQALANGMQAKKKAESNWQTEREHAERQAHAWDAGYEAGKAGRALPIAKLAYQKIDIGCMKEFEQGFQAHASEKKAALHWEDAQKEIQEPGEIALVDTGAQTLVVHAHDDQDGGFMFYVSEAESGEQLHANGGYPDMTAAKMAAEMWLESHAKSGSQDDQAHMAQVSGNDTPGSRHPDEPGTRPVSGEAIGGTGMPDLHGSQKTAVSQNKEYGFYGTVKSNFDLTTGMVDHVWDHMVNALRDKMPEASELNIEKFLDATHGRHLADELTFYSQGKESAEAVISAIDAWGADSKSAWIAKAFDKLMKEGSQKTAWGYKGIPPKSPEDKALVDMGKGPHQPLEPGDYGHTMAAALHEASGRIALSPEQYGSALAALGHSKEAVDQATKDYFDSYFGDYGKQLTKDVALKAPAKMSKQAQGDSDAQDRAKYISDLKEAKAEIEKLERKMGPYDSVRLGSALSAAREVISEMIDEFEKMMGKQGSLKTAIALGEKYEKGQKFVMLDTAGMARWYDADGTYCREKGEWTKEEVEAMGGTYPNHVNMLPGYTGMHQDIRSGKQAMTTDEFKAETGATFHFDADPEPDHSWMSPEELAKVEAGELKTYHAWIETISGEVLDSLGNITVASESDLKTYEAEMMETAKLEWEQLQKTGQKAAKREAGMRAKRKAVNEGKTPPPAEAMFADTQAERTLPPAAGQTVMWVDDAAQVGDRQEVIVGYDPELNKHCLPEHMRQLIKTFVQKLGGDLSINWGLVADIEIVLLDVEKSVAVVTFKAAFPSPFIQMVRTANKN